MKLLLCFLSLAMLAFSCKKSPFSNCTDDEYSYTFSNAGKIDTLTNSSGFFYQIIPGNNIVFKYTHAGPDCKNIIDEEYAEYLVFQVQPGVTSFQYQNNTLADALTIFNRVYFCPRNTAKVTGGSLKGTKISATRWKIEMNIIIPGTRQSLVVNRDFTLQ